MDQAEREQKAAERIFGLLPPDQAAEFRGLWEEFEARQTPEARYAAALDRFQPLLHNYLTGGRAWLDHAVTSVICLLLPILGRRNHSASVVALGVPCQSAPQ